MDLKFTREEESFRIRVRDWTEQNLPKCFRRGNSITASREQTDEWYKRLAQKEWLCNSWPKEHGGPGWSLAKQYIYLEESSRLGAPRPDQGVTMIGPLLIEHGTAEQKATYLPKIAAAEHMWCQGYSEPNAGSDLSNLALRAERSGENFILNGQKIWTSNANYCDMMFLLVRTDHTEKKKQAGISFMVTPLNVPGIEIRPIRQITGGSHFYEVFFTDTPVPVQNVIGEVNGGWALGMQLLSYERVSLGGAEVFQDSLVRLTELANEDTGGRVAVDDPLIRDQLARLHMELDALNALTFRGLTKTLQGRPPGSEASVLKLYGSELFQRICELALHVLGPSSQLWEEQSDDALEEDWPRLALASRAYTILGGTSEIQRNIIAERVLGLPRI